MTNVLKKYWAIFSISMQDSFQYRGQVFYWVFMDAAYLIVWVMVWRAVFKNQELVAGYTLSGMITYYILAFIVDNITAVWNEYNMEDIVRNGKLTKYIVRPMSFFWYRVFSAFSWSIARFVFGLPVTIAVLYITHDYIFFPGMIEFLMFLLSLAFSAVLYFLISYLISYFAFWMLRIGSIINILRASVIPILSGAIFPLDLLPRFAQKIIDFMPFKYLIYFPIKIYLNEISIQEFWLGIFIIMLWITVLSFLVWLIWPKALKKYESVGA